MVYRFLSLREGKIGKKIGQIDKEKQCENIQVMKLTDCARGLKLPFEELFTGSRNSIDPKKLINPFKGPYITAVIFFMVTSRCRAPFRW